MLALLVFVPASIAMNYGHAPSWAVFLAAAAAVIPLAGFMGHATEELAKYVGPSLGGLLNATFGNAAELIITIVAVRAGELEIVKASIVGSIIGNILLVLGLAIFLGGIRFKQQRFSRDVEGMQTAMMMMAVIAMFTPSLFIHSVPGMKDTADNPKAEYLSLTVAALLILTYLASLLYSLKTHQDLFRSGEEEEREPPHWSKPKAFGVLAAATAGVAVEAEMLVHHLQPTVESLGWSRLFVGVIVLPIIGNAAEHATAVVVAVKNKMDISFNICIGSSTQIALFVAPLLVFLSLALGHPMTFVFNTFELIAVAFSALIAAFIARDGRCNWLEGVLLLVVYAILALAFFYVPG